MQRAEIYHKEEFWCVDFIDTNYEKLPSVGMFRDLQDARQAALEWAQGVVENVALVGKGSW
jgi:hypothetical protein